MIIPNGTIEFKIKQSGEIDPRTGYPSKPKEARWSAPIPCQYVPAGHNLLARNNGEPITKATYTVLLEEQALPDSEQVRLTDTDGRNLGEYSLVAPPEALAAVCEIKIVV